jgi:8-amino-7-oxononanoate synthase
VKDAERLLHNARPDGQRFLITEGRFSMDGDTAPLLELADLCERTGSYLIVDEAHSVGLAGPKGAGLIAELGLQGHTLATVVTYGKAPGYQGAAILGSHGMREYLINFCRPFIYTTGPRAEFVSGLAATYDLLENRQVEAKNQLDRMVSHYRERIDDSGLADRIPVADGPIQIVPLAGNDRVMHLENMLMEAGYLVKGIRSPTVAAGAERLRLCLHAYNTEEEVTGLIDLLADQLLS